MLFNATIFMKIDFPQIVKYKIPTNDNLFFILSPTTFPKPVPEVEPKFVVNSQFDPYRASN